MLDTIHNRLLLQNGELFVFLYGALVQQILKDYENIQDVNMQIEKM